MISFKREVKIIKMRGFFVKLKLLFLLFCLNSAYQLNCMSRKTTLSVGAGATVLGLGSLAWQLYTKDYSLKKSLISGTLLGSGLASFMYQYVVPKTVLIHERALLELIKESNYGEIERLLDTGSITPNEIIHKENILHHATVMGKFNIVELLIKYGAIVSMKNLVDSLNMKDSNYFDLMMSQRQKFDHNILGYLDYYEYSKGTLLHQAAKFGSVYKLEKLIESGALKCLEAQDRFGNTPLCYAVQYNHIDAVKYLIKCGAQLDVITATGESLRTIARRAGIPIHSIKKDIVYEQSFMSAEEKPATYIRALPRELQNHVLNFVVNN